MIVTQRIGGVAPGKMPPAIGFAHEISAYIKSAHGVDVEGQLADKQFTAMVSKSSDNFVPGSFNDSIWRTI